MRPSGIPGTGVVGIALAAAMAGIVACSGDGQPGHDALADLPLIQDVPDVADLPDVPVPADLPADLPDTGPDLPPFTPGGCGLAPYAWLSRENVGTIVSFEEDPTYLLPPETIDSMLAEVGYKALSPLPFGSRLFRLRYRTQDKGVPREATALVGVPQPTDGSAGVYATVLWLHGTSGFSDSCAPSRGLDGVASAVVMAALGHVSVAPDYLGMNGFGAPSEMPHPYLVGEATAIASLDAVRAAHAMLENGSIPDEPARPDGRVVPWGVSQGGHAALWVDRLSGLYAPEFEVPATLAVVPPADLVSEARVAFQNASPGLGNFAACLVAAQRWYGHPDSMAGVLTDTDPHHYATVLAQMMDTQCGADDVFDGVTQTNQVYEQSFLDQIASTGLPDLDPWGCYLRENSLTATSWPRGNNGPVLMVLGQKDELVDVPTERASFAAMCGQQGYRMQLIECADAGHAAAGAWSLPEQRAWIEDRLAGMPMDEAKTCVLEDPVQCSAQPAE